MSVKSYSIKDLNKQISGHFRLREFFDPANYLDVATKAQVAKITTVKVDSTLLEMLEGVRAELRKTYPGLVLVNRPHGGYRPASPVNLNKAVGGASGSQHRYGRASDVQAKISEGKYLDASTFAIAVEQWCAKNGYKAALGVYDADGNYIHIDTRGSWTAWFDTTSSSGTPYSGVTHTQGGRKTVFKRGQHCAGIVLLQRYLLSKGYSLKADGEFGQKTYNALVLWQVANGIKADGKYGTQSNNVAKIFNW
jgi:uncharacterized protein YcbK (DUF882 family)